MKKIFDIEYERKLIELLGFTIVELDNSNKWLILDNNKIQVGHIEYKEMRDKNAKKKTSKLYGYYIIIDSGKVYYFNERPENSKPKPIYKFYIKRDKRNRDEVKIDLSEGITLTLWSSKYGHIAFMINQGTLFLRYQSSTKTFNIKESILYRFINIDREKNEVGYAYSLVYSKKNELDKTKIKEIIGTSKQCEKENAMLKIVEKSWVNGKIMSISESEVLGTIKEMAIKHEIGIEAFSHFRYLINKIIPFKEEVILSLVSEETIRKNGLTLFFPELEEEKTLVKRK